MGGGAVLKWLQRRLTPREEPRGVCIIRADGTVLNVDLVYLGRRKGLHHWAVVNATMRVDDTLAFEMLPAYTVLECVVPGL